MLVLTIRTDRPEAELGLFNEHVRLDYLIWQAHRELAATIHLKLDELLKNQQKTLKDVQGITVYKGPGSFTGLRIGISTANALADSLRIPIAAAGGETWLEAGIGRLLDGADDKLALPEYGAPVKTTPPRK
jgi:tRNA threonylcarbamoyladenosine biosynthesis protein TsaB